MWIWAHLVVYVHDLRSSRRSVSGSGAISLNTDFWHLRNADVRRSSSLPQSAFAMEQGDEVSAPTQPLVCYRCAVCVLARWKSADPHNCMVKDGARLHDADSHVGDVGTNQIAFMGDYPQ